MPIDDGKPWDAASRRRLLEDLLEEWPASDEEFMERVLWACPEDAAALDLAECAQAYDAAFDRALRSVRRLRKRCEKDQERRERALTAFRDKVGYDRYLALAHCHGWPMVEAHLKISFEARYRDPRLMLEHARRACTVAETTALDRYPSGLVFDLRARAFAELSNAYRVNAQFSYADSALAQAQGWLEKGTGDAGLLARMLDVEASLRSDQRRLSEALDLLDRAHDLYLEIGERHLAGRTLVSRGYVLYRAGDPFEAIPTLERGMALLDRERDVQLVQTSYQTLILYLTDCGEHSRAGELLLESGLREAFADQPLNLQCLRWVEAKIHAGMGRLSRAEGILRGVRAGFQELELEYDAALVGLDLAAVWLRQGEAERLLPLAAEMFRTFHSLGIQWEAQAALFTLEFACRKQMASLKMVESVRDFLARLRDEPGLKFDARSVLLGG